MSKTTISHVDTMDIIESITEKCTEHLQTLESLTKSLRCHPCMYPLGKKEVDYAQTYLKKLESFINSIEA